MAVVRDVIYDRPQGIPLELDLHVPDSPGPHPVLMWVHGGGWAQGSRADRLPDFVIPQGFALVSIGYRLSPVAAFPAQIQDCRAAVRWVREHGRGYGLDGSWIAAMGESAGGHLVSLLGLTGGHSAWDGTPASARASCAVQAVVDVCGVTDVAALAGFWSTKGDPSLDELVVRFLGGPVAQRAELMREASPLSHVGADAPPFLILHADADDVVPVDHSRRLEQALRAAGTQVSLTEVSATSHIGVPEMPAPLIPDLVTAFLKRCLAASSPAERSSARAS